jgi:RimJ/RimL family protein N-acetyltransferase
MFTFETLRLRFRNFRADDWAAVHSYGSLPEVARFENWGPDTPEDSKAFVARAMARQREVPRRIYDLAMILKADGSLVGGAALKRGVEDFMTAEIGYTFHPRVWGRGLATEVAQALVDFGFRDLGPQRIWATCWPENHASFRVLQKAGLSFEGLLKGNAFVRGRLEDALLCGISRDTWLADAPEMPA